MLADNQAWFSLTEGKTSAQIQALLHSKPLYRNCPAVSETVSQLAQSRRHSRFPPFATKPYTSTPTRHWQSTCSVQGKPFLASARTFSVSPTTSLCHAAQRPWIS